MLSPSTLAQAILSLLCYDETTAPQLAAELDPKLFAGRLQRIIATAAINYIKQYSAPPGAQIEYLLETDLQRPEEGKFLGQLLDSLKEQVSTLEPKFILNELSNFQEAQRLTLVAQEAIELVAQGDIEGAKKALYDSDSKPINKFTEEEIWLSDTARMMSFLDQDKDQDYFSTGIEAIDRLGARPARKTVSFIIAPPNKGKSWFLTGCAKAGIQLHHKGLFITLEMAGPKVAGRLLQSIFALTKNEVQTLRVPYFERNEVIGTTQMQFQELTRDPLFARRESIRKWLREWYSAPPLLIKEFPSGTLSIYDLELYLDYLKKEKDFEPDIMYLDYAELMKLNVDNFRIDIGRLWVALRGLAGERNFALVSASQGNREAADAKVVDLTNAAEDWSKVGTADVILTYSQTASEQSLGLSRILIAKSRDSRARVMVLNSQAYDIGQFSMDSVVFQKDVALAVETAANSANISN